MDTSENPNKLSEQEFQELVHTTAAKEAEAHQLFTERFDRQFPTPETPSVKLMAAIGWQFITICIQSVASIILAALRTAHMFYEAAAAVSVNLRYVDAGVSVLAIEFGVVIFAAIKAEAANRKSQEEDLRASLNVDVKLLNTGIIACVAISIIAGLGTSFNGFGVDITWFKIVLAVVMGAGASVVAWVSGDILGAMLARFGNARELAELEYRRELDEREAKKNASWEVAPERKIARSELVDLQNFITANRAKTPRKPKSEPEPAPKVKTSTRSNEVRMNIYEHLRRVSFEETRIPGPRELHRELGVSVGYASGVLKDWMAENQEDLLARGLVHPAEE